MDQVKVIKSPGRFTIIEMDFVGGFRTWPPTLPRSSSKSVSLILMGRASGFLNFVHYSHNAGGSFVEKPPPMAFFRCRRFILNNRLQYYETGGGY